MTGTDGRPDPDALLERVASEEARAKRGRLKIFFGASPGVGKTYAMLAAANRLREQGADVVVGIVETHGRAETGKLVEPLDVLPRRAVEYRGRRLDEFDLDAALARPPAVLLVDELAHTNAPGSRHTKRWQDVEELRAAGIEVWSTLNVQHLESLNDVVGGITGVRVQETLPDRVLDEADEIVLVDLPPDDLLTRLREGKVYVPEQAERATKAFFRKGNLLALRELALRRTADRVDDQMRLYRRDYVGGAVWRAQDAILAAVGPDDADESVVRSAARLAASRDARWHAIYVETPALQRLPEARRAAILKTLALAASLGAQTSTVAGDDVGRSLATYAREHNLGTVVLGRGRGQRRFAAFARRRIEDAVVARAPDVDVILAARGDAPVPAREAQRSGGVRWAGYAWALGATAITTLLASALLVYFDLANVVLAFLLAVVVVAVRYGRGPAVAAAVANVIAFDFFFVPPRFSFAVSDVQYAFTFAIMLVVGLTVAQLTSRLRYQARVARYREQRAQRLFELARELSGALAQEQVVEICDRSVETALDAAATLYVTTDDDRLVAAVDGLGQRATVDDAVARWAFDHGQPAGRTTDTLPAAASLYVPLKAPMRIRGVLAVEPRHERQLMIPEQRQLLETIAALTAIALERVHFVSVAQQSLVQMESERLRNTLLEALSHDLRTPLTALIGLADNLSREIAAGRGDEATARAIRVQAQRTAALVDNLLEMARLQTAGVTMRRDWHSLEELAGTAIASIETALAGHPVDIDIPADIPLLHCDGVLVERVLVNLLANAARHTPVGTPIALRARLRDDHAEIAVEDAGPGLPPGDPDALFEKFTRGPGPGVTGGTGLGLAICRTIVAAHRGRIRAERRDEGGARFVFTLPLATPPAIAVEAAA